MKKLTSWTRRPLALLLTLCMVVGMAACGAPAKNEAATVAPSESQTEPVILQGGEAAQKPEAQKPEQEGSAEKLPTEYDREDMELIVDLLGGQTSENMTDEELNQTVEELIQNATQEEADKLVDLTDKPESQLPTVDVTENESVYNEEGAMTVPFDQVYPELIEEGKVAFAEESLLVKLASNSLTDGLKAAGVVALEEIVPMKGAAWYEAKLAEGTDAKAALAAVRTLGEVLLAEYNYEVQTAALDDYKHFDKEQEEDFKKNGHNKDQWHFHYCGIPDGYEEMETQGGDSSVIVAVIDSGVDYNHEDLKDNMWFNAGEIPDNGKDDDGNGYIDDYYGVDIVAGKGSGNDDNGHGTHVAGIIAARNNNVGVMGVAYNVKIMTIKAAMHNGTLNQADIAEAVLYAYEMGAEVINMSFGGTASTIAVQDALATAYERCVLVASAGNSGENNEPTLTDPFALPNYPAALTYVLGVMSVDENGRESAFTNWDVEAFNSVEYELYAPGENIMSTLPGNRYGYLSGTSMAAPIVSSFAAILRSEFKDRDMYPTKFIYGQLSSTSELYADCLDPELHGKHNLPQIVDLNAALTKLPKPEVGLQEFAIFDSVEIDPANNNGDGVIDAGETIHLGLTLRNRWGMSENTQVTIDTLENEISDPYVEILNPTVNYGSVGTYSPQDCGKIMTDGMLTGWEDPFVIKIAKDIPNDYRMTFHVTITCENAIDETDETLYVFPDGNDRFDVNLTARNGVVLPSFIAEDMVLTADNLYIIPNATVIQQGATVRVEPGTHIQFWSDDPKDPYASDYIACLLVNGQFLVEGTKEKPVYIYPSQLMDHYGVEIGASSAGYVSLKYADITNFFYNMDHTGVQNKINLADHCTFRINYGSGWKEKRLSSGNVSVGDVYTCTIGSITARNSVFYKLGRTDAALSLNLYGSTENCIFVDCGISLSAAARGCVFLGNSFVDQTKPNSYSGATKVLYTPSAIYASNVYYREETGTTYAIIYGRKENIFAATDFEYTVLETADEAEWLSSKMSGDVLQIGIWYDAQKGYFVWGNGEDIAPEVDIKGVAKTAAPTEKLCFWSKGRGIQHFGSASTEYCLYELKGQVLVADIAFEQYSTILDPESTYQLVPISAPVQYPADSFLYESTDETVVTVSETGLVRPVGKGTADVWVYSLDRAVKNRVTIQVVDYVALEGLALPTEMELAVGENAVCKATLMPADTSRRNVVYTSSDPAVVKVEYGSLTGVSEGTAIITAACEGKRAEMTVTVYTKATELALDSLAKSASLAEGTMALPGVITNEGADTILSWRSTDENVATIEDGKVVLKALGTTSLIVTDRRSGLSASCLLIVSESARSAVKYVEKKGQHHLVLLENGELYAWDSAGYRNLPTCIATGIKLAEISGGSLMTLTEEGSVCFYSLDVTSLNASFVKQFDQEIAEIESYDGGYKQYYVITVDGNCYGWGNKNDFGQLGVGVTGTVKEPTLVNLDGVVDVVAGGDVTAFLTADGKIYGAGKLLFTNAAEPVLLVEDAKQLTDIYNYGGANVYYINGENQLAYVNLSSSGVGKPHITFENLQGWEKFAFTPGNIHGVGIKEGRVYTINTNTDEIVEAPGITDAEKVFTQGGTHYIITKSGLLFGLGKNLDNDMAGASSETNIAVPVPILIPGVADVLRWEANLAEGVLAEKELVVTFNKALSTAGPKLYADGNQVTLQYEIRDYKQLVISRAASFVEGVEYELVFDTGTIQAHGGVTNAEEIRIAFRAVAPQPEGTAPEGTEPEATEPEATEPVVYESILDESIERVLTAAKITEEMKRFIAETGYNYSFNGNAVLNPVETDTNVEHWLRIQAPAVTAGTYSSIPLGGNYWGTTNEKAIELQMVDYTDYITYAHLVYNPYLTEAPENTFPFATSVTLLNKYGDEVSTVGNEEITFRVTFNRDMDTTIPLKLTFGSAYPYADYTIEGKYVDARTWEGVYTLNTFIENGNQFFKISNGCSATEDLELQPDEARFGFVIDTTAAQAMSMQASATEEGIRLSWAQDDFVTLMGYNVYRSTKEDGQYSRINDVVIPAETMEFFDANVEPGKVYYYNFCVVQTDLTESTPSGKIAIMSKDTMAPTITHERVYNAFTGSNLVLNATVKDNLSISYADLYFRTVGQTEWSVIRMNKLNDKYSGILPASAITLAGVEYYIDAFDGVSHTYSGSPEAPHIISVQEAVEINSMGDVDGNGAITIKDALLVLQASVDKANLTPEQFARADLNGDGEVLAVEAMRILDYINGKVGSLIMQ